MRWGMSTLDVKLALRMLAKYPGLSVVGGVAIAFAILVGAVFFELMTQALYPALPLPQGERVVGVRQWDAERQRPERRVAADVAAWREQLRTLQDVAAFRTLQRNLTVGESTAPLLLAEMHAAGFRVAQVPPLLGRALRDDDEVPGAAPVLVLGHEAWQERFAADPSVVGRAVQLGDETYTVVGVMPPRFAFPISQQAWVALPQARLAHPLREGPGLQVVARLAPEATRDDAQAELAAWADRAAQHEAALRENLRPELLPFAESVFPMRLGLEHLAQAWSLNLFFVLFALLTFANVGMLVFARTATREGELVVRSAMGASRGRLVMQLFVEAAALGAIAVCAGLLAARFGMERILALVETEWGSALPFWFQAALSPRTVLYAAALGLLGCVFAGALPALKATARPARQGLQQASAGGGGFKFGGVWTAVIVAQIAITMTFPVALFFTWRDAAQVLENPAGTQVSDVLTARLEMDRYTADGAAADPARMARARAELERVLELDPAIAGVTHGTALPTMYHPWRRVELDDGAAADLNDFRIGGAHVAPDFFETLDAPLLAGRGLRESDAALPAQSVLVNRSFVERVLGGRNAVGRRVRYLASDEVRATPAAEEPWYQIVGVVPDLGMSDGTDGQLAAGIYHPLGADASSETDSLGTFSSYLAVRIKGDPAAYAARLQAIANGIDPALRLYDLQPLDDIPAATARSIWFWFRVLVVVSGIALMLALAGIYAVMSFTVARRTREIGIRVALGANPRRIAASVFAKPLRQIAIGLAAGACLAGFLVVSIMGARNAGVGVVLLFAGYTVLMLGVCLAACIAPTRRALAVQPQVALRDDG